VLYAIVRFPPTSLNIAKGSPRDYRLAWDHDRCRAVVVVYLRAALGWLRRGARWDGVTLVPCGFTRCLASPCWTVAEIHWGHNDRLLNSRRVSQTERVENSVG
jgi:hypothetical protein